MSSTALVLFLLPAIVLGLGIYARLSGIVLLNSPRAIHIARITTIALLMIAAFIVGRST